MKSIHRPLLRAAQLAAFAFPATALAQFPGHFSMLSSGTGCKVQGIGSIAIGEGSEAYGDTNFAGGLWSKTYNYNAFSYGALCIADSTYAGRSDMFAIAIGSQSHAIGQRTTAIGYGARAYAPYSIAMGDYLYANSRHEIVMGTGANFSPQNDGWAETDALFRLGNGATDQKRSDAITVLKNGQTTLTNKAWKVNPNVAPSTQNSNAQALVVEGHAVMRGNTSMTGNLSAPSILTSSIRTNNLSATNLSAATITSDGQPVITPANLATSITALPQVTVSGNSNLNGALNAAGNVHLGATGQPLTGLPSNVTGTYYGSVKTGNGFYEHDLFFLATGDENTADFIVPLGYYFNNGAEIKIDIATTSGDPDAGSAHYTLAGKLHTGSNQWCGDLIALEHRAAGGGAGVELYGVNHHGYTHLYLKFDAQNYGPGQVYGHGVGVKITSTGASCPERRDGVPFDQTYLIKKVDSTSRPNNSPITKSISADHIQLQGKVTLTAPQGDISMGIYE